MAGITSDPAAIAKDLHSRLDAVLAGPRNPLYPKICKKVESDGAFEKYAEVARIPFPSLWVDQRQPHGMDVLNTLTVNNNHYELTIDIDRDLVQDAKAWQLSDFVAESAMRMKTLPDKLCSALVEAGATSGNVGVNGATFYKTSNSFGAAGNNTFDNLLTGTGVGLIALIADLFTAIAALKAFKDDKGGLLNEDMEDGKSNLLIQCPVALEGVFSQILNTTWNPTLSAASGQNVNMGRAELFVDARLADVNDWYLHYVGGTSRPFIFQERTPMEVDPPQGPGSPMWINEKKLRLTASWRFRLAYMHYYRSLKVTNS